MPLIAGALSQMLLGGGSTLLGDVINKYTDEANAKGGQTSSITSREYGDIKNPLDASIQASKMSRQAIPGLQKQLNSAATGETGEAARQEFDIAHGQLGPSAAARNAASAQRQDASALRGLGAVQGQANLRQAAQQNKSMRQDLVGALRGGSPASRAAALSNYSAQNAQNNAGLFNQALQSQSANLAQAGNLEGAASQGLDASKQVNYATDVVPFLNQQGDYVGAENAATNSANQAAQSFVETQKQNRMNTKDSFQGIKGALGFGGSQLLKTGLYGSMFNEDPVKDDIGEALPGLVGEGELNIFEGLGTQAPIQESFNMKDAINQMRKPPVQQNLGIGPMTGQTVMSSITQPLVGGGLAGNVLNMFGPNQNLQSQQNFTGSGMYNNLPLPTNTSSAVAQLLGLLQNQIQPTSNP
jgi:hypothetical protein